MITNPLYNKFRQELDHFIQHLPSAAQKITNVLKKFEESIKNILVPGIIFEEMGFRYFGPLDGHNLKTLVSTIKNIKDLPGPKILHIITKKGKGYTPAEKHPEHFHSSPSFEIVTGKPLHKSEETFTSVFSEKLVSLAEKNPKIIAISAAMSQGTGLNIFAEKFPERFFDVGIAEEHAVAFSSSLNKGGLKPVVAIYSTFLQRAYDQIIHDVALQKTAPVFVLDRAGLVGEDGPTHHGVFDIAFLRTIPDLIMMAPKDKEELQDMLEFAIKQTRPVSIRFPKGKTFSLGKGEKIMLGKPQIIAEGTEICFLCIGTIIKEVIDAQTLLEKEGIKPTIVNCRFIKPLDEEIYEEIIRNHRLIITVEEGIETGGFGSEILEFCQKKDLSRIKIKIIGIPCEFITFGKREELMKICGLSADSIFQKTMSFINEANPV